MKHLILHHSDADGYCSKEIVVKYIQENYEEFQEIVAIPMEYGYKFEEVPIDWSKFENEMVYVVDFILNPKFKMKEFAEALGDRFFWIDHHQSSVDYKESEPFFHRGIVEVGKAACQLCWEYFFHQRKLPDLVHRVASYDVWDKEAFNWDDQLALQVQLKTLNMHFFPWQEYLRSSPATNAKVRDLIKSGRLLLKYEDQRTQTNLESAAWKAELEGLKVIAMNTQTKGSPQFKIYPTASYDALFVYRHVQGKHWECSLYSEHPDVDCKEVCVKQGGGGHPGAAGFTCSTKQLFKILKPRED